MIYPARCNIGQTFVYQRIPTFVCFFRTSLPLFRHTNGECRIPSTFFIPNAITIYRFSCLDQEIAYLLNLTKSFRQQKQSHLDHLLFLSPNRWRKPFRIGYTQGSKKKHTTLTKDARQGSGTTESDRGNVKNEKQEDGSEIEADNESEEEDETEANGEICERTAMRGENRSKMEE